MIPAQLPFQRLHQPAPHATSTPYRPYTAPPKPSARQHSLPPQTPLPPQQTQLRHQHQPQGPPHYHAFPVHPYPYPPVVDPPYAGPRSAAVRPQFSPRSRCPAHAPAPPSMATCSDGLLLTQRVRVPLPLPDMSWMPPFHPPTPANSFQDSDPPSTLNQNHHQDQNQHQNLNQNQYLNQNPHPPPHSHPTPLVTHDPTPSRSDGSTPQTYSTHSPPDEDALFQWLVETTPEHGLPSRTPFATSLPQYDSICSSWGDGVSQSYETSQDEHPVPPLYGGSWTSPSPGLTVSTPPLETLFASIPSWSAPAQHQDVHSRPQQPYAATPWDQQSQTIVAFPPATSYPPATSMPRSPYTTFPPSAPATTTAPVASDYSTCPSTCPTFRFPLPPPLLLPHINFPRPQTQSLLSLFESIPSPQRKSPVVINPDPPVASCWIPPSDRPAPRKSDVETAIPRLPPWLGPDLIPVTGTHAAEDLSIFPWRRSPAHVYPETQFNTVYPVSDADSKSWFELEMGLQASAVPTLTIVPTVQQWPPVASGADDGATSSGGRLTMRGRELDAEAIRRQNLHMAHIAAVRAKALKRIIKSPMSDGTGRAAARGRKQRPAMCIDSVGVEERAKPHRCEVCEEAFTRRNDLQRHVRSKHSGERPFSCPACSSRFARKDKLLQHIERDMGCSRQVSTADIRVKPKRSVEKEALEAVAG